MTSRNGFEAIKYALRQSKDGVVVSFVVHPNEVQPELMALPIGARVMIGWAEVGDDEIGGAVPKTSLPGEMGADREAVLAAVPEPSKPKARRIAERSLAEQCAIICNDARFRAWLSETWGIRFTVAADADAHIKARLNIRSKTELNDGSPNFNAEAAANFKLLVMTYESHQLDNKYADINR